MRAFGEIDSFSFKDNLLKNLKEQILKKGKDYILKVDEEEFIQYLVSEFQLEPLVVHFDAEIIEQPTVRKEWVEDRHYRERYQVDVYNCTVSYPFEGSSILFKVRPSSWIMRSDEISVNDFKKLVSTDFKIYRQDAQEFQQRKMEMQRNAFANLDNINAEYRSWNASLEQTVRSYFLQEKSKLQGENDFFAAINVKIDQDTTSVFSAPTIKKKIIPQPQVSKNKEFVSEPAMAKAMYDDILKVIYDFGKSMEKKPSTYHGKDEEALRDQFLVLLETRYDSTTATGETFNKSGKTDIILKYANDGTNLFVAECKFWHGNVEFQKAISQLFDRYLTWRDSKVALIFFVDNKDFSKVIETIRDEAKSHQYFVKELPPRGETSFSYIFSLPIDNDKEAFLEIIAFHFN